MKTSYMGTVGLVLLSGTFSSILGKALYGIESFGIHGKAKKPFAKPWASTLFMFIGMFLCLPLSIMYRFLFENKNTDNNIDDVDNLKEPLLPDVESRLSLQNVYEETTQWWHKYDAILYPTLFDLTATALMSIGLLFVTASCYQMLRGTEILFTALLTVLFLHRKLNVENVFGLLLCAFGIVIVGVASFLDATSPSPSSSSFATFLHENSTSAAQTLLGMILIITAEAVQSSQVIAEEYLMSVSSSKVPPIHVVGYEGLFGTIIMSCIVLPMMQLTHFGEDGGGMHEDSIDTWNMLCNSSQLTVAVMGFIAVMAVYNVVGMMLTDKAGALTRTVAETVRTLFVWGLDLGLYYHGRSKTAKIGEAWTTHSWLQAVGFAVLVLGTIVYSLGDEKHSKEVEEALRERARQRWSALRASVSLLHLLKAVEQIGVEQEEARKPIRRPRIAGPARIRTALHQLRYPVVRAMMS